jgi:L-fuconolactonase
VPPFIDMCVDAFGPDRMMVGTDPSSSVREGYANVWGNLQTYLTKFSRSEQDAILGGTAARLFTFGS